MAQCAGELPVGVACRPQFLGAFFELGCEVDARVFEAG